MIEPLSQQDLNLLRIVYARRSWLERLRGSDERIEALRQIEASRKVAAIFELFPLVNSEEQEFAKAVARTMRRLFEKLEPQDFPSFDENIRERSWSSWNPGGYSVVKSPQPIQSLARFGEDGRFLTELFSCHTDGYTREAAIRALASCQTGEELPFLLLRINDWVENVRAAAAELLNHRIREEYAHHFVRFLSLVLRLSRAGRANHHAIVTSIQSLLAASAAFPFIEEGTHSTEAITRRFCYGIALNSENPQRLAAFARQALNEENFRILLDALRAIGRAEASSELKEIVDLAIQKPVASVRLAALLVVIDKYAESANAECRNALFDRNAGVRQQAQFHLQKAGGLNVCNAYVEVLSKSSNETLRALPQAVAGIGEVCSKSAVPILEPYLSSPRAAVRLCAYRSLAQLDREHPVNDFLNALEDESAKVVRVAALFLRKRVNLIGGERIWEIHARLTNPRHRRWTLFLVRGLTKWDSCYYLIRALSDVDAQISELARRYLERWMALYNKSFVAPSKEQRARLKPLIRDNSPLLSTAERRLLGSVLEVK